MKTIKEKLASSLKGLEKALIMFDEALSKEECLENSNLVSDPNLPSLFLWGDIKCIKIASFVM